jgi:hypothetical protein
MQYKITSTINGHTKKCASYAEYGHYARLLQAFRVPYVPEIKNDADEIVGKILDEQI